MIGLRTGSDAASLSNSDSRITAYQTMSNSCTEKLALIHPSVSGFSSLAYAEKDDSSSEIGAVEMKNWKESSHKLVERQVYLSSDRGYPGEIHLINSETTGKAWPRAEKRCTQTDFLLSSDWSDLQTRSRLRQSLAFSLFQYCRVLRN